MMDDELWIEDYNEIKKYKWKLRELYEEAWPDDYVYFSHNTADENVDSIKREWIRSYASRWITDRHWEDATNLNRWTLEESDWYWWNQFYFRIKKSEAEKVWANRRAGIVMIPYDIPPEDIVALSRPISRNVWGALWVYNKWDLFKYWEDWISEFWYDAVRKRMVDEYWFEKERGQFEREVLRNQSYMLQADKYMNELDVSADASMKVQLFTDWRTMKEIADYYNIPVEVLEWTDLINWVKAWWAFWDNTIYLLENVKQWTFSHELFHAVFATAVPNKTRKDIIKRWVKLFNVQPEIRWWINLTAEDVMEEILADEFAHRVRTWEFTNEFANLIGRGRTDTKARKYRKEELVNIFKDFAKWLWLTKKYWNEVTSMFNDIVNCKYLPNDWKKINWAKSLVDYNDKLNNAAIDYFWKMLWFSSDVVDEEYVKRVQTTLSDMLWMDINTFNSFPDKAELYMKIDKRLTLERLTTWRFDKEIVDIKEIRDWIRAMSDEDLAEAINK
jgi:hypothetical protein